MIPHVAALTEIDQEETRNAGRECSCGDGEMDMMEEYFAYKTISDDEENYKGEEDCEEEEW